MHGAVYLATATVHVLAAVVWLGGMFFLALVGAPVLRRVSPPELRRELFDSLGRRFRVLGWASIGVLIASGVYLVQLRGWLGLAFDGSLWSSPAGRLLAWKLAAIGAMLALTAVHDFVQGPSRPADGPSSLRLRRGAALTARAGALLGLIVLLLAVRLARGI